ncbi:hypothetical protein D1007_61658 [Hordeum vulgare]|uniref:Uncharacterized protein n=1 Tax=Hordeum vulgare subsp. vulgare TaxID=112509 RepID=A0A8I7B9W8_HORVV|nr:hypothetical protein D1007_61658 [Hordeum vulgare]KAI4985067.1 hypothetical protein ZWY2020_017697 [Hordeum vulgare]
MSSLIDIWTVEVDRIRATRRTREPFRPAASSGAQEGGHAAHPSGDGHGTPAPRDGAMAWPAKDRAAGAGSPSSPVLVREDAFLSILVDCFGQ